MLVTKEQAKRIVDGCKLIAVASSTGYGGQRMADVVPYTSNKHGAGYAVTVGRVTRYYVCNKTVISSDVYHGHYSVADAAMTSQNVREAWFEDVKVTPTWCLKLDTVRGDCTYYRTDETPKPCTIAGRTLRLYWQGPATAKELKARIRRRMRTAVKNGLAEVISYAGE